MSYVKVFVWVSLLRARSPGHAAMALFPQARTPEDGYISFAPSEQGSISGPGKWFTLDHDLGEYAGPHHVRGVWIGKIYGLNVQAVHHAFKHHLHHPPHYNLFNECASQVHRYLQIGGGDRLASWWSRKVLLTWSPDDVEDYAKSIIRQTRHLGSHGQQIVGEGTIFK